jgi:hypothetical protein
METLYIAGPMTGIQEFNFPAFRQAAQQLRDAGHVVVSPHEWPLPCGCVDLPPRCGAVDHAWAEFLRSDLIVLLNHAEGVALLPGWEKSRGATLEVHVAEALGMPVRPLDEWLSDLRPQTEQLLGIAPEWLRGKSVDEYLEEIRED